MRFELNVPPILRFGPGVSRQAAEVLGPLGRRVFLVRGSDSVRCAWLQEDLRASGAMVEPWVVSGEPTLDLALEGVRRARELRAEVVVALGGGSVLDAGKAVAALVTQPGEPRDYLERAGAGRTLEAKPLPMVALPTTAGTGSEVTRNAVLGVPDLGLKVSLRHPWMVPAAALVDPDLTHSLPPEATASTGMDALTQLIEPFLSPAATPFTDALCRAAIPKAVRALPQAHQDGHDPDAREAMAWASLCGGLALAHARLGAVHGFAAPIGGLCQAPHGAVCAALLPDVLEANLRALRQRDPQHPALSRLVELGRLVTSRAEASAEEGIEAIRRLQQQLSIPPLSHWGITADQLSTLSAQAAEASSMQGNPIRLTPEERLAILEAAL